MQRTRGGREIKTMQSLRSERVQAFRERHQMIDLLRSRRELGGIVAYHPGTVRALLQELDLLQIVAQAAEHLAAFPCGESAGEPLAHLRNALRRWKE
jgi:hypothetical protein